MKPKQIIGGILGVVVTLVIANIPVSAPLTPKSMMALGLLVGSVTWILFEFMQEFLALMAMCFMFVITGVAPLNVAFGQFTSSTIWLMVGAFGIGAAASESGLVQRITMWMLKTLPATFRGQSLAYVFSGLVVSPIVPSSTAKAVLASVLVRSTSESMGFACGSQGARGLFLAMYTGYVSVAQLFLTGSAVNPAIVGALPKGSQVDWMGWLWIALPGVVIASILMVLCIFRFYNPKDYVKPSKAHLEEQYKKLGPMQWREKLVLFVTLAALIMWILESVTKINSAAVACFAFMILMTAKVIDIKSWRLKTPWDSWIFVGCFLCLPGVFATHGINEAIKINLGPVLAPVMGNMPLLVLFICLLVYLVRLVLVSLTGTTILVVTVMLPFCTEYNIHPFMIAIIAYMATNTWNVSYQNTQMIAALAATDNKVCSNRDILGGSVLYMITVVVGCMLALPVWKFMGLY